MFSCISVLASSHWISDLQLFFFLLWFIFVQYIREGSEFVVSHSLVPCIFQFFLSRSLVISRIHFAFAGTRTVSLFSNWNKQTNPIFIFQIELRAECIAFGGSGGRGGNRQINVTVYWREVKWYSNSVSIDSVAWSRFGLAWPTDNGVWITNYTNAPQTLPITQLRDDSFPFGSQTNFK